MLNFPKWTAVCALLLPLMAVDAEPTSKPSPPDAATVKEAVVTVNEVYKNDIAKAKTPDERATMVGNLIAAAVDAIAAAFDVDVLTGAG